jgi:hypothetical protein
MLHRGSARAVEASGMLDLLYITTIVIVAAVALLILALLLR